MHHYYVNIILLLHLGLRQSAFNHFEILVNMNPALIQAHPTPAPNGSIDGYLGSLQLPTVDWHYFLEKREAALEQCTDLPAYLLLPEVELMLSETHDQVPHFLINTLMHTGARISEALKLTEEDFKLDGKYPEISIPTLKTRRGRPSKKASRREKRRRIPLMDGDYIDEALRFFATQKRRKHEPLFNIDRSTAYRWVKAAEKRLKDKKMPLSIPVGPHTLRHSFAVNAILNWVPTAVLQNWLGHENRETTEIYTQVFQTETYHFMARVSYRSGLVE